MSPVEVRDWRGRLEATSALTRRVLVIPRKEVISRKFYGYLVNSPSHWNIVVARPAVGRRLWYPGPMADACTRLWNDSLRHS